jgi:peptidoglycan/LPS O-acetylase OafA/YrhL
MGSYLSNPIVKMASPGARWRPNAETISKSLTFPALKYLMGAKRLFEIDALRGLAAAGVALVFHQHFLLGRYRTGPLDDVPGFAWLHNHGWTLVDLFFVISGCIFSHVYLTDGRMNASLRSFAAARIARLYPLHLVTLLFAALVLFTGMPATVKTDTNDVWHFLLNILMLQESGLNAGFSFNFPAWSISVEVICYAVFFLIAASLSRALMPLAIALTVGAALQTNSELTSVEHISRGICGFFAGVLAYRFRSMHLMLPITLIAAGIFLIPDVTEYSEGALFSLTLWPGLVMLAPRMKFLNSPPLVWLGDRSYSLYLVHAPVYWAINIWVFSSKPVPAPLVWPALVGAVALILLLADLSYRHFEEPARHRLKRLASAGRLSGLAGRHSQNA